MSQEANDSQMATCSVILMCSRHPRGITRSCWWWQRWRRGRRWWRSK